MKAVMGRMAETTKMAEMEITAATETMKKMKKRSIVCFGDSNTHGYDSRTGGRFDENVRWPCVLQHLLGEGYHVHEEGLSGRTAVFDDPLFEGLNGLKAIFPCLLTHEPVDLLIIMLGTNDVKSRFHMTAGNIGKGMERLLRKAIDTREAWREGRPRILLISPPPIDERYFETEVGPEMGPGCAERSRAIEPFYRAAAERADISYLNAAELPGMEMYPYDYMHLSPESHRILAEHLSRMIPDYFE